MVDGSVVMVEGSVVMVEGSVVMVEGSVVMVEGSVVMVEGATNTQDEFVDGVDAVADLEGSTNQLHHPVSGLGAQVHEDLHQRTSLLQLVAMEVVRLRSGGFLVGETMECVVEWWWCCRGEGCVVE